MTDLSILRLGPGICRASLPEESLSCLSKETDMARRVSAAPIRRQKEAENKAQLPNVIYSFATPSPFKISSWTTPVLYPIKYLNFFFSPLDDSKHCIISGPHINISCYVQQVCSNYPPLSGLRTKKLSEVDLTV